MPSSNSSGIITLRHRTPKSLQRIYQIVNHFNHQYRLLPRTHNIAGIQFQSYELANSHLIDDSPMLRRLINDCQNSDIVFDIGANIGTYSLVLAQNVSDGKILAFEPVNLTYKRLAANLSTGGKNTTHSLNIALSSESGNDEIFTDNEDRFSTLSEARAESKDLREKTNIQKACLDELDIPTPDRMKIDTEGHELKVLQGATKLLDEAKPILYIEPHDGGNYDFEDISGFLRSKSYIVKRVDDFVVSHPKEGKR